MTRMTGPDCAVMCNLINTHTHAVSHTSTRAIVYTILIKVGVGRGDARQ